MQGAIQDRAPRAHCYLCGDLEIAGICHHCHRMVCKLHLPPQRSRVIQWMGKMYVRLGFLQHFPDETNVHCRDCRHNWPVESLLVTHTILVAYIGLGLWMAASGSDYGLAVIVLGLLLTGLVYFLSQQPEATEGSHRTGPVDLAPRVDQRTIREWVFARLQLDPQGNYSVEEISTSGTSRVSMSFGEADRERVKTYLKKNGSARPDSTTYRAGFAVMKGQVGALTGDGDTPPLRVMNPVQPLTGIVASIPMLTGASGYEASQFTSVSTYRSLLPYDSKTYPVQVFPSLHPETGRQALDLTIQWSDSLLYRPPVYAHQVAYISLHWPVGWGNIIASSDPLAPYQDPALPPNSTPFRRWNVTAKEGDGAGELSESQDACGDRHQANWLWLPISDQQRKHRQRTLYIKFEHTIDPEQGEIDGEVMMAFAGSFSGITGLNVFGACGGRTQLAGPTTIELLAHSHYTMWLNNLRHQEIAIYPEVGVPTSLIHGVPPTAETVMALTSALSQEDQPFYVRWTVENPSHTGARADVTNRYWDIGGRFYQGVYPIDFHLVLTGNETQGPANESDTSYALTVQGAFSDNSMRERISNTYQRLDTLIRTTLQGLAQVNEEQR